jgi:hypothetical protein
MLRGGLKMRNGFRRIVTNNIIVNNSVHPHVSFKNSGDMMKHNILIGPYQPIYIDQWDWDWDNNLITSYRSLGEAQELGADKHSILGHPMFVDPATGDFRVRPRSPALKIGFKNFPMDFGVESARLRPIVRTPVISELLSAGSAQLGKTYDVSGATVKSIETLDEQSALGSDELGALVNFGAARHQSRSRRAGAAGCGQVGRRVRIGFPDCRRAAAARASASHKWQGRLHIDVLRDHKTIKLEIPYE